MTSGAQDPQDERFVLLYIINGYLSVSDSSLITSTEN
jgi:hypothetical protein